MTDTTNKYCILIVDDDSFLVDMYALKFTQAGHEVQSALSGQEALTKLESGGCVPDAVVFDLVMPHMDGFQFIEELKTRNLAPNAVLIVLSNQSEREDLERAKELGAAGHIVKANAIPSEVLAMVATIVANHKK